MKNIEPTTKYKERADLPGKNTSLLAKILHLLPFDVLLLQIQIGKPQTRHWPEGNLQGTHGVSWEVGPVDLRRRCGASQQRTTTRRVSRSPGNNHPSHCATQSLDTKVLRHIYHRNKVTTRWEGPQSLSYHKQWPPPRTETSEILVSREFPRIFFNFHFLFSISSRFNFTFTSRKRVKGFYFSLFTSRKKWKLSVFHSFFSSKKSEIRCGV